MKLTIIKNDNAIYKDGFFIDGFDTSLIPNNIHALQFDDNKNIGHIEYVDNIIANEIITEIPDWAKKLFDDFDIKKIEIEENSLKNIVISFSNN